ncbi:MAG: MBL fold metallo-hydrolase [Bacteroidota bacterium]
MKIIVHRGTNQIGGSCIEIKTEQTRIIFDVGEELPDIFNPQREKKLLVVDDLFKDSSTTNRKIDGIIISHNHGDHIGLIDSTKEDIPIFIGKVSAEIHNTISNFISERGKIKVCQYLEHEKSFKINDITITPYLVDHSAFDSYAFMIENNGEKILYTGDFRRHGVKGKLSEWFYKNPKTFKPNVLLIEGTNLYKDEFVAETEIELSNRVEGFMKSTKGNVFVLQSAVNIDRLVQIYKAAKHTNRLLLVDVFTANILAQLPDTIPNPITFKDVKVFYPIFLTKRIFDENKNHLAYKFAKYKLDNSELKNRTDLCVLVRENMLFDIKIKKRINVLGAGVIYSKWEGYKIENKVKTFLEFFDENNCTTESFHTSGHADTNTIKDFIASCQPKKIIPVHTETPRKYVELFGNIVVELSDGVEYVV